MAKLIDPLSVLSTELVAAIFSDLDVKTVLSARKVCRYGDLLATRAMGIQILNRKLT